MPTIRAMLYNLATELDRQRYQAKSELLLKRGAVVELTEKMQRTRAQNSYLHLLIGVVAMETGNTLQYCKDVYFKRIANPGLFIERRKDALAGEVELLRSSADLSKEEMQEAIDRFKRWGAENGFYLPNPGDESLLRSIEIEMARMKNYL